MVDAGHLEGDGARDGRRRGGEIGHLGDDAVAHPRTGPEHVDGGLGQVARPLGAGHHEGSGSVGAQAAVELVQG